MDWPPVLSATTPLSLLAPGPSGLGIFLGMPMAEKKTSRVTIWLPESLELDLLRRAANDDRKLSDFITHLLMNYCYGHFRHEGHESNVAMRTGSPND